jgi:hypothetical protein
MDVIQSGRVAKKEAPGVSGVQGYVRDADEPTPCESANQRIGE